MIEFAHKEADIEKFWFENSNYLVLLAVNNEEELVNLIVKAEFREIKLAIFREPDLGDQITAVAFEPGKESRKLCRNLKLTLSE